MSDLDLDIGNYTIHDLEKFFKFTPETKYAAADVEYREYEIREQLLNSGHIDKRMKRDLISFLNSAKEWLISAKCKPPAPTTLPKIPRLDQIQYPASAISPDLGDKSTREQNVVERPTTAYTHTLQSDYFPGAMNPLNTRVITKCLTIDTRFRDNYFGSQSSDLSIQLPSKLTKVVSMQLSAIELPVTFYTITEARGNNFLYLSSTYTVSGDTVEYTDPFLLVIPDGNYNGPDLVTTINQLLSPKDSSDNYVYPESPFSYMSFTLDVTTTGSGTARVYLDVLANPTVSVSNIILDFTVDKNGIVDNRDLSTKLGWNLGFRKRKYTGATYYLSDTVIEPNTLRYVYLAIDDFNHSVNNHFIAASSKFNMPPNVLARISLKGSYFAMIMENDLGVVTEPRKYFGPVDIQRLRIQLLDDRGNVLAMNNVDFSFCLVFKQLYDL